MLFIREKDYIYFEQFLKFEEIRVLNITAKHREALVTFVTLNPKPCPNWLQYPNIQQDTDETYAWNM